MTSVGLFPLGTMLVPGQVLRLTIFEPRYRRLLADLSEFPPEQRHFAVVAITVGHEVGDGAAVQLAPVGTLAKIRSLQTRTDGTAALTAVGTRRFRLGAYQPGPGGYLRADITILPDSRVPADEATTRSIALAHRATDELRLLLQALGRPVPMLPEGPDAVSFALMLAAPLDPVVAAGLLAIDDTDERLIELITVLRQELHLVSTLKSTPRPGPEHLPPAS
ncbi:MAG: LON peptidase substrate-binding domain-containing protein [Actinomycetales bacterium]